MRIRPPGPEGFTSFASSPFSCRARRAAGITKGSAKNLQNVVGSVTKAQVREIALTKLPDLNTTSIDDAIRSIEGSARSMGIEIK
mgnify:CR=1 FL=1